MQLFVLPLQLVSEPEALSVLQLLCVSAVPVLSLLMWVSAILGMTTKYAEGLLAIKYRTTDENGEIAGGPMYYIQNGLGDKFKWLAKLFAFLAL